MNTIRDLVEQYEGKSTAEIVQTAIGFELFAHKDSRPCASVWVVRAVYPAGESVVVNGQVMCKDDVGHADLPLAINDMRNTIADAIDTECMP